MRVEGLETLDYLDNLQEKERFTEQGDAITFESEVGKWEELIILLSLSLWYLYSCLYKVHKIYLSTPLKIAIIDHEKKRTFVLRKDGLPDAGKFQHLYQIILSFLLFQNSTQWSWLYGNIGCIIS